MATMVAFSLLMAFLFGGMMLALVMGYAESEKARKAQVGEDHSVLARAAQEAPHFFAESPSTAAAGPVEPGVLDHLEGYLRAEQALVARFVNDPSVDNLYRPGQLSLSVN